MYTCMYTCIQYQGEITRNVAKLKKGEKSTMHNSGVANLCVKHKHVGGPGDIYASLIIFQTLAPCMGPFCLQPH